MSVIMAGKRYLGRLRARRGNGRGLGRTNGIDAAVGFRPLRIEAMEERTLLSIDMQFSHVVYDFAANMPLVGSDAPGAPRLIGPLSSSAPVSPESWA